MSVYIDASVLVALFTVDANSAAADDVLRSAPGFVLVSDFAAAEFASAVARKVRMSELTVAEARDALADFDLWTTGGAHHPKLISADLSAATTLLRRLDLSLRTPDAIHLAIARRLDATLITFDRKMATDAVTLGEPTLGS